MDEERERDGERYVDSDESKQVTLVVNAKMVVLVVYGNRHLDYY